MIPEFPRARKLTINDKAKIDSYTHGMPPYSDFNFITLWSWDVDESVTISQADGNLVLRLTDDKSGQAFYTFIGPNVNRANDIACAVLALATAEGLEDRLRLIPEQVVTTVRAGSFLVEEDRDNHDYILSAQRLASYDGRKFAPRKRQAKSLLRQYPNVRVAALDLTSRCVRAEIDRLVRSQANSVRLWGVRA